MRMKTRNWMKITLMVTTMTVALSAQTGTKSFDPAGLRQELEIMKGILHTTLNYALEESDSGSRVFSRRTESFYLYGQGAVFVVNLPFRTSWYRAREVAHQAREVAHQKREIARQKQKKELSRLKNSLRGTQGQNAEILRAHEEALRADEAATRVQADTGFPVPPPPPASASSPAPSSAVVEAATQQVPEPPEQLEEQLHSLQNYLQDQQRQMAERNAEIEKKMVDVEKVLLEALSRHGGSFRSLSEGEFVTLILKQGKRWLGRSPSQTRVLVVPKSALTEFDADRIGWDAFLRQVVSYQM